MKIKTVSHYLVRLNDYLFLNGQNVFTRNLDVATKFAMHEEASDLAKRNGGSVVKVETSFIEVAEDLPNEKSN